jgi:serine/threonine-protein kinase HipA
MMRKAKVSMHGKEAGVLIEHSRTKYTFQYLSDYSAEPISLTMPVREELYVYDSFPPFFEGLLPEGYNKNQLLRLRKIDAKDYFSLLMYLGQDVVGATTITENIDSE